MVNADVVNAKTLRFLQTDFFKFSPDSGQNLCFKNAVKYNLNCDINSKTRHPCPQPPHITLKRPFKIKTIAISTFWKSAFAKIAP
jgi:hypothetical protein